MRNCQQDCDINANLDWLIKQDVEWCKETCEWQMNRDWVNREVIHCTDWRMLRDRYWNTTTTHNPFYISE